MQDLHQFGLMNVLKTNIQNGKAYLGCGAGSNISWFNIKTNNNIPNVYPFSSDCLAMAALSINPFILIKILI
ncbi:MAG: hypothetical protein EOO20_28090 [Chryseobacterium sp.]|nr:MAG: hypothetical protein EOO20_28090 [Chryseobacterium sp.]